MKRISFVLLFLVSTFISLKLAAQDYTVPELPSTKKEFVKSEPEFINAINWLEKTVIGPNMNNRLKVNLYVIAWITNSPTVTVQVRSSILSAFDKNAQLLAVFLGGYARYCLQNNYSTDELKCNTAGLKAVINCYNLGGDLKKDKTLLKLIDLDKEGKLEDWVKDAMK